MTVGELIAKLDAMPSDAEVMVVTERGHSLEISDVELSDKETTVFINFLSPGE